MLHFSYDPKFSILTLLIFTSLRGMEAGKMIKFKVLFGMTRCPFYLISTLFQSRLTRSRFTTVHGGWSSWGAWGSCSKSCGNTNRFRYRSCTAPTPTYGGRSCIGSWIQSKSCMKYHCPGKCGFC